MNPSQKPPKTVTIGGIGRRAFSCAAHWNRFTAMSPGVHCKGDVCNAFGRFWRLCLLLTVFLIETRFNSTSTLFHPKPCSKRGSTSWKSEVFPWPHGGSSAKFWLHYIWTSHLEAWRLLFYTWAPNQPPSVFQASLVLQWLIYLGIISLTHMSNSLHIDASSP